MGLRDFLEARAVLSELKRIGAALEAQNALLARIADHLAPPVPIASEQDLAPKGPIFTRDEEQARILDFRHRYHEATGKEPTEDQIAAFLDGDAS